MIGRGTRRWGFDLMSDEPRGWLDGRLCSALMPEPSCRSEVYGPRSTIDRGYNGMEVLLNGFTDAGGLIFKLLNDACGLIFEHLNDSYVLIVEPLTLNGFLYLPKLANFVRSVV